MKLFKHLALVLCAAVAILAMGAGTASAHWKGVNINGDWGSLPWTGSGEYDQLTNAQDLGSTVVRVQLPVTDIEGQICPTPNNVDTSGTPMAQYDEYIKAIRSKGMWALLTPYIPVEWNGTTQVKNFGNSEAIYVDAVKCIVSLWGSDAVGIEIGNEPNTGCDALTGGTTPSCPNLATQMSDYMTVEKAAYNASKQFDSSLPVIAGSLAYADVDALQDMYSDGLKNYADAISWHAYTDGGAANVSACNTSMPTESQEKSINCGIDLMQHIIDVNRAPQTLDITEAGWPDSTATYGCDASCVNDSQDQYGASQMQAMAADTANSNVGMVLFYTMRDDNNSQTCPEAAAEGNEGTWNTTGTDGLPNSPCATGAPNYNNPTDDQYALVEQDYSETDRYQALKNGTF